MYPEDSEAAIAPLHYALMTIILWRYDLPHSAHARWPTSCRPAGASGKLPCLASDDNAT